MSHFKPCDRHQMYLLPASIDEWLPENYLSRFIIEVIEQLDLTRLTSHYSGKGSEAYHPSMMLALLVYGYATGTFSSRKIERATHDSVAFRFLSANIKVNASKHKALSHGHIEKLEAQLREEVQFLLNKAAQTDEQESEHDFDLPAEIVRREQRLEALLLRKPK